MSFWVHTIMMGCEPHYLCMYSQKSFCMIISERAITALQPPALQTSLAAREVLIAADIVADAAYRKTPKHREKERSHKTGTHARFLNSPLCPKYIYMVWKDQFVISGR